MEHPPSLIVKAILLSLILKPTNIENLTVRDYK